MRSAHARLLLPLVSDPAMASSSTASSSTPTKNLQELALQAETFRRLHPRTYLERFLNEGFRPDSREVEDWRDVSVNVGGSLKFVSNIILIVLRQAPYLLQMARLS